MMIMTHKRAWAAIFDCSSRMQHIVHYSSAPNTIVMNGGKYRVPCQKPPSIKKDRERTLNAHPRDVASFVQVRTRAARRGSNLRAGGGHKWRLSLVQLPFISAGIWSGGCSGIVISMCGKGSWWGRELNHKAEFFGCLRVGWSGFYSVSAQFFYSKKTDGLWNSDFLRVRHREHAYKSAIGGLHNRNNIFSSCYVGWQFFW